MHSSTKDLSIAWQVCLMTMLVTVMTFLPSISFAAGVDTPIGNVLCTVKGWFTGNTGKGLATIAITIIGIGALLGKVSWGMAIIVGIGVAIVFGAAGIVDALHAGDGGNPVGASAANGCLTNASFNTTVP